MQFKTYKTHKYMYYKTCALRTKHILHFCWIVVYAKNVNKRIISLYESFENARARVRLVWISEIVYAGKGKCESMKKKMFTKRRRNTGPLNWGLFARGRGGAHEAEFN